MHIAHEFFLHRAIEKFQQWIEIAGDVEQPAGLVVHAQLRPCPDLEDLLECSDAARQRDESIRELAINPLSLVHRPDDPKIRQGFVRTLPLTSIRGITPMISPSSSST